MNNSPINDFVRKAKQTSSDVSEELQSKMETASAHTETLVMQVDEKLGGTGGRYLSAVCGVCVRVRCACVCVCVRIYGAGSRSTEGLQYSDPRMRGFFG